MGHGAWSMEHGAWSMGHGAWSMGHGAWGMEHTAKDRSITPAFMLGPEVRPSPLNPCR